MKILIKIFQLPILQIFILFIFKHFIFLVPIWSSQVCFIPNPSFGQRNGFFIGPRKFKLLRNSVLFWKIVKMVHIKKLYKPARSFQSCWWAKPFLEISIHGLIGSLLVSLVLVPPFSSFPTVKVFILRTHHS